MAWNGTKTWAVGEVWTAADANSYIRDNTAFLHDAPSWSIYRSSNQSIAHNTVAAIAFNSERRDTNAFHDTVTNNSRATIPTGLAGMYGMTVCAAFANASTAGNERSVHLRVNGATFISTQKVPPMAAQLGITTTRIYPLAQGDYVEAIAYQDSGGAMNIETAGNYSPEFAGQWLSS